MRRAHRADRRAQRRQSVLDRIVKLRRADAVRVAADRESEEPPASPSIDDLSARVEHLEGVVEDLQDAFHRQSVRRDAELEELKRNTKPAEIARALAADARTRGL
jgi:hypothetical protein